MVGILCLCWILLFIFGATYALVEYRYLYRFPFWFSESIKQGFFYLKPRFGFVYFQLPSLLMFNIFGPDLTFASVRLFSMGALLTFYPSLILMFIWKILKSVPQYFLYILLSFGLFLIPIMAPSFNGAQHGYGFFVFLIVWQAFSPPQNTKHKLTFIFCYFLIAFFYAPTTLVGTFFLALEYLLSKKHRKIGSVRDDLIFYFLILNLVIWGIYLVFLPQILVIPELPGFPVEKTYDETILAFKTSLREGRFYALLMALFYPLSFFISEKKGNVLKICALFGFTFLSIDFIHTYWESKILPLQYRYRIYSYLLGFAFLLPVVFKKIKKLNGLDYIFIILVTILASIYDIQSTFIFKKKIEEITLNADPQEKCSFVEVGEEDAIINARNIHYYTFLMSSGKKILFAKNKTYIRDKEYFEDICGRSL